MLGLIKNKVLKDIIWVFVQRGGSLIISFLANIILARLLSPDDFGCIGIILVFVSIANVLVDSGLGSSLIHKRNVTQDDMSTIFTCNFIISISIFTLLFIEAPAIARYFNIPELSLYLRIESIAIIIRAFYVVQSSMMSKNLRFKDCSKISIIASAGGALAGIVMAYMGLGVWSLIIKNIIHQLISFLLFRIVSKIPSRFGFNKTSFKQLFGYGWFIALTSFLDLAHSNLASFIIGNRYSVKDLGYYNQASSLQQIPTYSLSMVITHVLFPYMSKVNDDMNMVNSYAKRVFPVSAFAIMPLMIFLIIFAQPIINIIFSAKWLPATIYFQILCFEGLFNGFIHINRNILKSIGETKLLFNVQLFIVILGITLILITSRYNILIMISSIVTTSCINWAIVSSIAGKRIYFSIIKQIKDIIPSLIISIISGCISYFIYNYIELHLIVSFLISTILFFTLYFGIHYIFKTKSFKIVLEIVFPNRKIYE